MWGTSSPDDKLTGDLANVIEAISIDDRGSDCLAAGKLAPAIWDFFNSIDPKRTCGDQLFDHLRAMEINKIANGNANANANVIQKATVPIRFLR